MDVFSFREDGRDFRVKHNNYLFLVKWLVTEILPHPPNKIECTPQGTGVIKEQISRNEAFISLKLKRVPTVRYRMLFCDAH